MDYKELLDEYKQYEKYVYSILGTSTYHSKTKTPKVNIYYPEVLCMTDEDLIQQGRMYLWEALINFRKYNYSEEISSKSTFVFRHIKNMFINLGIKTTCKKYKGTKVPIEDCFNIKSSFSTDSNLVNSEISNILEISKKYKRKDPEKYRKKLKEYWIDD